MKIVSVLFFLFFLFCSTEIFSQPDDGTKFDLNSNLNYRTITGIDGGNFLDVSLRPNLSLSGIFSAEAFINVPYNLSTNEVRKLDLKAGNIFRFARLGDESNYIQAGALEQYSVGAFGMVVNKYNNQLDAANKKVGMQAGLSLPGFGVSAMANDISKPQVFTGGVVFSVPIIDNFRVGFTGGIDLDPDNNSATDETAAAYGVDLVFALPFDYEAYNYFYVVGSAAAINKNATGQSGMLGFRFGSEDIRLDLQGSLMRLGPGFGWGFFDSYYESDRKSGFSKVELLKQTNQKAVGASNLGFQVGFGSENDLREFGLTLGGFYFTDYSSNDLNKFDSYLTLNIPRSLIGETGRLVNATLYLQTREFTDFGGLLKKLTNPDDKTVIYLDLPVYLLSNVLGIGDLAFVMNYRWDFAFQSETQSFISQRNLITGFRIESSF